VSEGLVRRGEAAILPTYPERPLALVRGAGCTVWDEAGRPYLDLVAGLAVCSLGHGHPAPAAALAAQAFRLGHVSNLFWSEPSIALAERLHTLAGFGRVFFCNSGAEALEAGIKLARRRGGERGGADKHEIVCLERSFHGRTLATLAAGGSAAKRDPFAPVPAGFLHVPANDVEALRAAVGPQTAAVLLEPVQGEGGVWPLTPGYLAEARALCDRHDALLILDEVQTGIGRLGAWFGFQLLGVRPDAVCLAKGLGAGLPIGALIADEVGDGFQRGDHASTFGGSPPIAAAALAVLDAIEQEGLVENARTVGAYLAERAATIAGVASVRGHGLLLAIELAAAPSADVALALRERGILVNAITPTALRLVPPLCLARGEADAFCDALADVLGQVLAGSHA
jgi:acetylornithine/N-succinyldiaminopimelate aminotransferase